LGTREEEGKREVNIVISFSTSLFGWIGRVGKTISSFLIILENNE